MNNLSFIPTKIQGSYLLRRKLNIDERGTFSRIYCNKELNRINIEKPISQINFSETALKGTVRGMHFQLKPYQETKIVTCLKGSVFDVVVDLRYTSPTFLKWHSEILSSENKNSLVIPEGCAHGFQTLEQNCKLLYLHTEMYSPESERTIHIMDSILGINWPIKVSNLSNKDSRGAFINESFLEVLKNEM